MSSLQSVASRRLLCLALVLVPLLAVSAAGADVSDPRLLENVNREIESRTFFDAVELEDFDVLFQPAEAGLWRTNPQRTATVRVDTPEVVLVLGPGADRRRAFYAAAPADGERVLYVTDGTDAGTRRLGPAAQRLSIEDNTYHRATTGLFYFNITVGQGGAASTEVWVTDGTPAGTRRVLGGLGFPASFGAEFDGLTLFAAEGRLHRTNGTAAGTALVRDDLGIRPLGRKHFYPLATGVVFAAVDDDGDRKLWISDGTADGTQRLDAPTDEPERLTTWPAAVVSGHLFYAVRETFGVQDRELFVSDGTPGQVRGLTDSLDLTGIASFLTPIGGHSVFFDARTDATGIEPWISNGTNIGTRMLADLCPGECGTGSTEERRFPGGLYARIALPEGSDIFVVQEGGGIRALDVCFGPCPNLSLIGVVDDRLYYRAETREGDRDIFFLDPGLPPKRLTDFAGRRPIPTGSTPRLASGGLYVPVEVPGVGVRVFRSEGVPGDAREILALDVPFEDLDSNPSGFLFFDGSLNFVAEDGIGGAFLFSKFRDGPASRGKLLDTDLDGAEPVADLYIARPIPDPALIIHYRTHRSETGRLVSESFRDCIELSSSVLQTWDAGGSVYFTRREVSQIDLLFADQFGTVPVAEALDNVEPVSFRGRLYFSQDGTLRRVQSTLEPESVLDPSTLDADAVTDLLVSGDRLYVALRDIFGGSTLAVGDGTGFVRLTSETFREGVVLYGVADGHLILRDGGLGDERRLWSVAPGGEKTLLFDDFFGGDTVPVGDELWLEDPGGVARTDGRAQQGRDLPMDDPAAAVDLYGIPGGVIYVERGGTPQAPDDTLWFTDGTAAGTRRLGNFVEVGDEMAATGGRVYFAADDGVVGMEPWVMDILSIGPPPTPSPVPPGAPEAPRNLEARGDAFGFIEGLVLTWDDFSALEERFEIQVKPWGSDDPFRTIGETPADVTEFSFNANSGIDIVRPNVFRVRAVNAQGSSPWSEETVGIFYIGSQCHEATTLCLQNGHFQVEVFWRSELNGTEGRGTAVPFDFSDDSGTFWFFEESNVELVAKVLDGRTVNDHFWNFYGALSDVNYLVVVEDTFLRQNIVYENPEGNICGDADIRGFLDSSPGNFLRGQAPAVPTTTAEPLVSSLDLGATGCVPDGDTLCLTPDRFRVSVTWRDQRSGDTGVGHAIPGTSDSGYFWFFNEENVELVVKVLDARTVNGFHWVFYGALTDVEYTLTVTDTVTGETNEYFNPPGNICGGADVTAF